MKFRAFLCWLFACVLGCGVASSQVGTVGQGGLVPSTYQEKVDRTGATWNLQQNGVLGRPSNGQGMIGNALMLFINNNQFQNYQPMATKDGEMVLGGQNPLNGLTVTRRIKLLDKEGVMRVVEVIHNPSAADVTCKVEIRNNFNGRFTSILTDSGRPNPNQLKSGESGVVVIPSTNGHPAFLFSLCSAKSKIRPTLTQQNQYQLNIAFPVTVPAGRTVTLAYTASQLVAPQQPDSRWLGKKFRELSLSRHLKGLPRELVNRLVNSTRGSGGGLGLLAAGGIDELGVERAGRDVLAMGEGTRLLGGASCGHISLKTSFGECELPFEKVAALVGGNQGRASGSRIYLRDGQVFSGAMTVDDFRFVLTAGATLEIDPLKLDRLVRSEVEGEGEWGDGVTAMVMTTSGDRFAATGPAAAPLRCATPWGALDFSLDDVLWIAPPENEAVGSRIQFKDGTLLGGFLSGPDLEFDSPVFEKVSLPPNRLRALLTRSAARGFKAEESGGDVWSPPPGASITLAGEQRLAGRVVAPKIVLLGPAEPIEISPASIRRVEAADGQDSLTGAPRFLFEMWGGGVLLASFRDSAIPCEVRGKVWDVPASAIVEIDNPLPVIPEGAREKITKLVRELGSDDWAARESATDSLIEFGYLARGLLEETLAVTPDPEVRHRVEKILAELP